MFALAVSFVRYMAVHIKNGERRQDWRIVWENIVNRGRKMHFGNTDGMGGGGGEGGGRGIEGVMICGTCVGVICY